VAACAGAWLGEAKPALLIADSGFLVATWPLASLAVSYDIPMRRSAILREAWGTPEWIQWIVFLYLRLPNIRTYWCIK
jgi:sulfopyruvate decarboxylase TPP-binding subunit